MTVMEKPTMVSGGCLCGSVRYTITFPADHDWDDCVSSDVVLTTTTALCDLYTYTAH